MSLPNVTLPLLIIVILAYWAGRRFQWWPSFLPG